MAYSSQPKYSQSIQFTYNKTPYDSYETAVRMVTKKNLLPGEPAACFYKNDDDELKMLLAIGTGHGQELPLILSETNNTASILSEIESIKDLLGDDELNIINENDNIILRTVTETLNYLYNKTIASTPLDETEYTGIENLPGVDGNPELTIGDSVNVLLKTVEYLIRTVDNMIVGADETERGEFYEEDDDWERVYSAEKVNELIEDVVEHTAVKNWNWRSAETHGTLNLVQNGEAIYFEVDGGELLR